MIYSNELIKKSFSGFLENNIKNIQSKLKLNIIQIGNDLASTKYVSLKKKLGNKINISVNIHKFDTGVKFNKIQDVLDYSVINNNGLIFQLPVPMNLKYLVQQIPYRIDVDLLGNESQQLWQKDFLPPTIGAIDLVLKDILLDHGSISEKLYRTLNLSTKIVVVVGQGTLVGGPLLQYLKNRSATIISLNKFTKNPQDLCKMGDIVITAAGTANLINNEWLKSGSIVIDASTSEEDGTLVGDINMNQLGESVLLCPSPGGIGAITVLYLFYNLFKLKNTNFKL